MVSSLAMLPQTTRRSPGLFMLPRAADSTPRSRRTRSSRNMGKGRRNRENAGPISFLVAYRSLRSACRRRPGTNLLGAPSYGSDGLGHFGKFELDILTLVSRVERSKD